MGDIVHMRGEGGSVIPMELPFPEHIADRVAKGHIVRVNADGSDFVEPAPPAPAAAEPAVYLDGKELRHVAEQEGDPIKADKPKPAEAKAVWVAYAEAQGMDRDEADALSKANLIKRFG